MIACLNTCRFFSMHKSILLLSPFCTVVASKVLPKTLVDCSCGYLDKENLITRNLKSVPTSGILADPATY